MPRLNPLFLGAMANKYEIINNQSEEERMKLLLKKNNSGKLVEFAKHLLFGMLVTLFLKEHFMVAGNLTLLNLLNVTRDFLSNLKLAT